MTKTTIKRNLILILTGAALTVALTLAGCGTKTASSSTSNASDSQNVISTISLNCGSSSCVN